MAFGDAPADLGVALATAMARSDAGASELLRLVESGHVPASLLRHRYVAMELENRRAPMPAKAAELTAALPPEDARLDALVAQHLQSFAVHRKDRAQGAAVFSQQCAACHKIKDTGGTLGPSLDGIGSRDVSRLLEDILDPSRNIDPAFRLTTVKLKSGEVRSGMDHRQSEGRVQLTDPGTGQTVDVASRDVVETVPTPISAMPAAFESILSEAELFDLIAYLRGEAP
jgi:putative heme-binding domain-containing protein